MAKKHWGFDVKELDPSIRPQDDFYGYVNKIWCKAHPIPASESRWGTAIELRYKADHHLKAIFKELSSSKRAKAGSPEQMVRDFYCSGLDMKNRNALGLKPLDPYRKKIHAITSVEKLQAVISQLHRIGVGVGWGAGVGQDSKNSERYILHLFQDGLGMPDRDYYLKNDAESVRVRTAYIKHVEKMYRLIGRSTAEAKRATESHLRLETALAKASMTKEDMRDPHKTYHKMTISKLAKEAPSVDWKPYFKITGADPKEVIVMQPQFLNTVGKLTHTEPLEVWKDYLEWHLVSDFSSYLSAAFIKESFSFYGTVLSGTKTMRPLWRRVLNTVNGNLGELLGQIYVKKHFNPESKKKMHEMVDDLFTAYEMRLKGLDWMSPQTKKKALKKLHALNRKIGYPDKWKSYRGLKIVPDDYVGNIIRTNEFEHKRAMKRLLGPIERWEWFMYPQTVNAYFAPTMNDIVFPAAILQPPFFSMQADEGVNYGCIGMTIGHEITHGFDDEGAQYDEKGNLKSWWTAADRKKFETKAKVVEKQFDQYTVADGVRVNGKLTLGENIADLGGLSIAYDAYQLLLKRTGRKDIDGFTPEQRFFFGYGLFERENVRPEFEKTAVLTDAHAPGFTRINGPLSNMAEFYKAFGVKKGDKLYREPAKRAKIW